MMALEGHTWTTDTETHSIRIQHLTDDERSAFIEHVTGAKIDPFLTPPEEETRYVSFLIKVENRAEVVATFNPQDCWLVTSRNQVLYPLVLDDLGASYRAMGSDLPEAYNVVRPAIVENRTMLLQGESIAGLLVYNMIKPKTKNFQIDVTLNWGDGNTIKTFAPYRRPKKK